MTKLEELIEKYNKKFGVCFDPHGDLIFGEILKQFAEEILLFFKREGCECGKYCSVEELDQIFNNKLIERAPHVVGLGCPVPLFMSDVVAAADSQFSTAER